MINYDNGGCIDGGGGDDGGGCNNNVISNISNISNIGITFHGTGPDHAAVKAPNPSQSTIAPLGRSKQNEDYRWICFTASRLEAIQNKLESVMDIFITPLVNDLYRKLCRDCLKLLFECEFKIEHFRIAEELVWKRVYHDTYRFLKTRRQFLRKQDEYLVESHFLTGIGFYTNLITRLRFHFSIDDAIGAIPPLSLGLHPIENILEGDLPMDDLEGFRSFDDTTSAEDKESDAKQWARLAIYRSLIYIGDLSRYLLEFGQCEDRQTAFILYRTASRYQPSYGLPFNQLATLAGCSNFNLDAVCNYMRSCCRPKPFERAEGNLAKVFELVVKYYHDLIIRKSQIIKASEVYASKEPAQQAENVMRSLIVTFIKLTSDLWYADEKSFTNDFRISIVNETQLFFELLREAIELEPFVPFTNEINLDTSFYPITGSANSQERPKYVSPTIMYEFCSISIMLIAKRQRLKQDRYPESGTVMDLVNLLALNILHYATYKCHKLIMNKVQEIRLTRQNVSTSDKNFLNDNSCDLDLQASNRNSISRETNDRQAFTRVRHKEAFTKYSDRSGRNLPSFMHGEDSDMSELEETALSTIDALEISSDMSEGIEKRSSDNLINLDSSSDEGILRESIIKTLSRPPIRSTRSQNYGSSRRSCLMTSSSSSLPRTDLLSGNIAEISFRTTTTSHDITVPLSDVESEEHRSQSLSLVESTLAFVYNQTYLPSIKIYFDWLLSNGSIIESNMDSFMEFQKKLLELNEVLNEMLKLIEIEEVEADEGSIFGHTYNGPDWSQKYPLDCDYPFVNLEPLEGVHNSNIDFDSRLELSDSESGYMTIQCINAFTYALTMFLKNKTMVTNE